MAGEEGGMTLSKFLAFGLACAIWVVVLGPSVWISIWAVPAIRVVALLFGLSWTYSAFSGRTLGD